MFSLVLLVLGSGRTRSAGRRSLQAGCRRDPDCGQTLHIDSGDKSEAAGKHAEAIVDTATVDSTGRSRWTVRGKLRMPGHWDFANGLANKSGLQTSFRTISICR